MYVDEIEARRPVYSSSYGRTAHALYIAPLLYEHETLLVSLSSMGSLVQGMIRGTCCSKRDLICGIKHLKQTLQRVNQRVYEKRWAAHTGGTSSQYSRVGDRLVTSEFAQEEVSSSARLASNTTKALPRSREANSNGSPASLEAPDADDAVLFNAFSYASNSCVSAFLAIANICLENCECLGGPSMADDVG